MKKIKNRIKKHIKIRAGDLITNELNFRTHSDRQRKVLEGIYGEVGFARSLLVYEVAPNKYKLIDGHLRQDYDPEMIVDVEVLDVNDEEAKKLLAVIDPLSSLAGSDSVALKSLLKGLKTGDEALAGLFSDLAKEQGLASGDDLELEVSGSNNDDDEGENSEEGELELSPSQVRMVQLYMTVETLPVLEKMLKFLAREYGTNNTTDTAFAAIKDIYKLKRKKANV